MMSCIKIDARDRGPHRTSTAIIASIDCEFYPGDLGLVTSINGWVHELLEISSAHPILITILEDSSFTNLYDQWNGIPLKKAKAGAFDRRHNDERCRHDGQESTQ